MDETQVSLSIRAVFDSQREAVGISMDATSAFDEGDDARAKIEVIAAIVAKANAVASELIRTLDAEESVRQELVEHYVSLKEQMLEDMLQRMPTQS